MVASLKSESLLLVLALFVPFPELKLTDPPIYICENNRFVVNSISIKDVKYNFAFIMLKMNN
jgi:hypothetical protein